MPDAKKRGRTKLPPPEFQEFGKLLKQARKGLGVSLKEMGERLGYSAGTVGEIEEGYCFSGARCVSIPRVYELSEEESKKFQELRAKAYKRNNKTRSLVPPSLEGMDTDSLAAKCCTFAYKLSTKRVALGLSQKEFSKAKNIGESFVKRFERGLCFHRPEGEKIPEAYGLTQEETEEFLKIRARCEAAVKPIGGGVPFNNALYIYVDDSKYELPLYVCDSLTKMSAVTGIKADSIRFSMYNYYRFGFPSRFRTTIEPETEDDEIEEMRIKNYLKERFCV